MFQWVALAIGLLVGPARAADMEGAATPSIVAAGLWQDPLSEAEKKRQERLAALEASQSTKAARVVVLEWEGKEEVDYQNETLVRMVKTRIARPDANFYPEIDLYQEGRKEHDPAVRPADQRAMVPEDAITVITAAAEATAPIPWNGLSESDWGLKAQELLALAEDTVWFVDRPELREPLFKLYVQLGRAAENANNPTPPFYEQISGRTVNYFWYLAGAMGHVEPAMMSKLTDQELYANVDYFKQLLDQGQIKKMTLSFEEAGIFDPKAFASDYQVFINGLEILIDDKDGLVQVPPGRVDVYMKRADGSHSLSDTVDITKLEGKIYFVRDVARKKMGVDFIEQLMEHPNECTPQLDGDILTYLAIYARLHTDADIYIGFAEAGNPNRILIWRWDRPSATLQKVLDNTGGFPVRFAILGSAGIAFNGASVKYEPPDVTAEEGDEQAEVSEGVLTPSVQPASLPLGLQLRGHIGRLMVLFGFEAGLNIASTESALASGEIESEWEEYYQIQGDHQITADLDGNDVVTESEILTRTGKLNHEFYGGIGVVLLKNAAVGLGPRGYVQFGGYDMPHTFDVSGHVGITLPGPLGGDGRIRSLIDVDGFGGALIPYGDSLLEDPTPNFGVKAGIGLTF